MTISQWLNNAKKKLQHANIEAYNASSEIILAYVLKVDRLYLLINNSQTLSTQEIEKANELLLRRENHEPTSYLTGTKEFYGLNFTVNKHTLIPRADTEILVESVLKKYENDNLIFADLGTGSGCIAISLLANRSNWTAIAIDNSEQALEIANLNAKKLKVEDRINFIHADIHSFDFPSSKFNFIVSNPPYITKSEYNNLDLQVKNYEPKFALIANENSNGLETIKAVINFAEKSLEKSGGLYIEHGFEQAEAVKMLFSSNNWKKPFTIKDLSNLDRITTAILL